MVGPRWCELATTATAARRRAIGGPRRGSPRACAVTAASLNRACRSGWGARTAPVNASAAPAGRCRRRCAACPVLPLLAAAASYWFYNRYCWSPLVVLLVLLAPLASTVASRVDSCVLNERQLMQRIVALGAG